MTFYARMQQSSNRMLRGKGQTVTLTHTVPGTYDPTTGLITNATTTQTGTGAVMEYNNRNVDGTLIKQGDRQLLLSPFLASGGSLVAPAVGDTATIGGTVFTVTQVKQTAPAGTVVMYDCNLRV